MQPPRIDPADITLPPTETIDITWLTPKLERA